MERKNFLWNNSSSSILSEISDAEFNFLSINMEFDAFTGNSENAVVQCTD